MAQNLTSDRIGLTVAPDRVELVPGFSLPLTVIVTNQSNVVDQLTLQVEGIDPRWFTLAESTANLFPGAQQAFIVPLQLPENEPVNAGTYSAVLSVTSRDDPSSRATFEVPIEIRPTGTIEMIITPQAVTTRRLAQYQLQLTNRANAEFVVDLTATDADQALELQLATDRVALPPGAIQEVGLTARPRSRPLIAPPRTFAFRVLAAPAASDEAAAAEPLAGADGTLTYRSLLPFLAGIPPRLRRWLLPLLLLLLLAALALWALGRPGAQLPFVATPTPIPTPQPAPTVAPAPQPAPVAPAPAPDAPTPAPAQAPVQPSVAPIVPPTLIPVPVINRFEMVAAPPDATQTPFVLSWDVSGAREVTIDGQARPSAGTLPVTTNADAEHVLEARNDGGLARRSIGVIVLRPPQIDSFAANTATIGPGGTVTLSWQMHGSERADIDGIPITGQSGSLDIRPEASHVFTLTAENEFGTSTRQTTVNVTGTQPAGT